MKNPILTYKSNTLDYDQVSNLLTNIWTALEEDDQPISSIKKIYSVSNECLENIYKHSDFVTSLNDSVYFTLEKNSSNFIINASNPLGATKVKKLKEKVSYLNTLNTSELKNLYQYEIKKRSISNKGGAGLGLIIIARKSNCQLKLEISEINEELSQVIFTIKIPFGK